MIFDAGTLPSSLRLEADLCVVGSGPGGAMVAMRAAEAGLRVVVLEAGEYLTPGQMSQREEEMLPRLFWEGGNRTTRDRAVRIHQGRGVGGSSLHNLNLCKRIPLPLRVRWAQEQPLEHLPPGRWDELYEEVESLLAVSAVTEAQKNRHNQLLEAGCRQLGWRGGVLAHNRTGCVGSGFCEVGCAFDAKNNALKIAIPRALRAGAQVLARCQAVRVLHERGEVRGVEAIALTGRQGAPSGRVVVTAPKVCLAASATGTPAVLLRSGLGAPDGAVGDSLRIHPAVVVAGDFDEPVHAWRGVPQSYECTEHLDFEDERRGRLWIVAAFAHPVGASTLLPGLGAEHTAWMNRYAHLAAFTAMLHDHTRGRVRPNGDLGVALDYWPDEADRTELARGLAACAELLLAAGARRVLVPGREPRLLNSRGQVPALANLPIEHGQFDITAVHPMASVPMSDDPKRGAFDSEGRHHTVGGLWAADASLFPSSIGVPPQLSVYALGLHVGDALARA